MHRSRLRIPAALAAAAALLALATVPAAAHTVQHAGSYTLEIGWQAEPTYVGSPNGVQVVVTDGGGKPVTDLGPSDLTVVVSTGSNASPALAFAPAFDLEEMTGQMGEYDAAIEPTAPGDYTFHITGSIHGTAVDVTVTSGDTTFDAVKGTSDIEFPVKLPTIPEIATRLDRIDARTSASAAPGSATQAGVDAATASAADARSAADTALLVGGAVGGLGVLLGAAGLAVALRARRVG